MRHAKLDVLVALHAHSKSRQKSHQLALFDTLAILTILMALTVLMEIILMALQHHTCGKAFIGVNGVSVAVVDDQTTKVLLIYDNDTEVKA